MSLIEAAAKANFEHYRAQRPADHGPYQSWDELDEGYREYLRGGARAALAVFEGAYTPTNDEREALARLIDPEAWNATEPISDAFSGDLATQKTYEGFAERRAPSLQAADRVLAGFHRTVQGEPREGYCSHCGGFTGTAEEVVAWLQGPVEPTDVQGDSKDLRVAESAVQGEPCSCGGVGSGCQCEPETAA